MRVIHVPKREMLAVGGPVKSACPSPMPVSIRPALKVPRSWAVRPEVDALFRLIVF